MSQQGDGKDKTKCKNDSNVVNGFSNSKSSTTNITRGETGKTVFNKQNTSNNLVNTCQSQNCVPNIREDMVVKATEFLLALPRDDGYPVEKKYQFLQSKGMTNVEILEALDRTTAYYIQNPDHNTEPSQVSKKISNAIQTPLKSENWFIRLLRSISYAATAAYIGYQIYKNYIENWLFGKKTSVLEKRFDVLEQAMQKCITLMEDKNIGHSNDSFLQQHQIDQIRAELKSIKSLLLNRSQFPSTPPITGIPQWQLTKRIKPHMEQQKIGGNAESSSLVQQNTINGVNSPISNHPMNAEKTNGIETFYSTQPVEEKGPETTNFQQQNLFYDHHNASSEFYSSNEKVSTIL